MLDELPWLSRPLGGYRVGCRGSGLTVSNPTRHQLNSRVLARRLASPGGTPLHRPAGARGQPR